MPKEPSIKPVSNLQRLHKPSSSLADSKQNKILTNLDALHERAHVAENLQLVEEKRLKVANFPITKRKHRTPPTDLKISFTQLTNNEAEQNDLLHLSDNFSDSDSELPDAIISMSKESWEKENLSKKYPGNCNLCAYQLCHFSETPLSLARRSSDSERPSPNKRRKYSHIQVKGNMGLTCRTNNDSYLQTPVTEKLFLDASDSDDSVEIVAQATPPGSDKLRGLPAQYSPSADVEWLATSSPEYFHLSSPPSVSPKNNLIQHGNSAKEQNEQDFPDVLSDLEELDSWLESNSVEVL